MPDGILPPTETTAPELAAETADSRLLRHVRRNLVLWSGGTTLVILIALAIALYVAAAGSLESAGITQLDARMATIKGQRPDPDDTSRYGFIFGGGGSGTFAMILDPDGQPVLSPRDPPVPAGLPRRQTVVRSLRRSATPPSTSGCAAWRKPSPCCRTSSRAVADGSRAEPRPPLPA